MGRVYTRCNASGAAHMRARKVDVDVSTTKNEGRSLATACAGQRRRGEVASHYI